MTRRTKYSSVTFTLAIVALVMLRLVHAQQTRVRPREAVFPAQQILVPPVQAADVFNSDPPPVMRLRTPQTIIESFVRTETELRQALNRHTFKRDVVLQTIGPEGQVTGEYVRHSEFLFDDRGRRIERVTYHPPSTIREMRITKEDIQDLAGAQLLGIDITESTKYRLTYRGEELLNGKRVFVLSVEPAVQPDPYRMSERYFRGSVWIDATTCQMVKVSGVVEPQGKQRFPRFDTWREVSSTPNPATSNLGTTETNAPNNAAPPTRNSLATAPDRPLSATFAFPSRTEADDVLHFPKRDVNYRIRVRYYDYKLFASTVSIKELDQPDKLIAGTQP